MSVILPSLTDQMVLGIFKYLVEAELRKSIFAQGEFRFGCQEGMVAAISLMFGDADDLTAEIAFDQGKSWLQIVTVIKEDLQSWTDTLEKAETSVEVNWEQMRDAVDKAVNSYALKHPRKLGDALRMNL